MPSSGTERPVSMGNHTISTESPVGIHFFPPPGIWGQKATRNGGPQFGACLILSERYTHVSQLISWILERFAGVAFQPEFGAYRGLARVLKSPLNPQNCRKKEKILKKGTFIFCAKLWYAPNPGSKEI